MYVLAILNWCLLVSPVTTLHVSSHQDKPNRKPHNENSRPIQWHNVSIEQPNAGGKKDGIAWHVAASTTMGPNTNQNMSTNTGNTTSTKTGKTMVENNRDHPATNERKGRNTRKKMIPNTQNTSTKSGRDMKAKAAESKVDNTRGNANAGKSAQSKMKRKLLQCDGLPILNTENTLGIVQSYDASYHRRARVAMLQQNLNMTELDAKGLYAGIHRRCATAYGPPPGIRPREKIALIVSGQTRTFLNDVVLDYWQKVTKAIRLSGMKMTAFAVLDEVSKTKDMQNRSVQHNDSIEMIESVVRHWARGSKLVFLHGDSSMIGHARLVKNPQLRSILTPEGTTDAETMGEGFECGYMKLVIGLDLMLEYERQNKMAFAYVLRSRPDYIYLNWFNPVYFRVVWDTLIDVVYMMNDVMAMMPRRNAGAYFTSFLMHRGLKNSTQFDKVLLLDDMVRNNKDGSSLQPTTMMAIHGILFAGHGLELDTWLPGRGQDSVPYPALEDGCHNGVIVREDAEKGPCLSTPNPILSRFIWLPFCE